MVGKIKLKNFEKMTIGGFSNTNRNRTCVHFNSREKWN